VVEEDAAEWEVERQGASKPKICQSRFGRRI